MLKGSRSKAPAWDVIKSCSAPSCLWPSYSTNRLISLFLVTIACFCALTQAASELSGSEIYIRASGGTPWKEATSCPSGFPCLLSGTATFDPNLIETTLNLYAEEFNLESSKLRIPQGFNLTITCWGTGAQSTQIDLTIEPYAIPTPNRPETTVVFDGNCGYERVVFGFNSLTSVEIAGRARFSSPILRFVNTTALIMVQAAFDINPSLAESPISWTPGQGSTSTESQITMTDTQFRCPAVSPDTCVPIITVAPEVSSIPLSISGFSGFVVDSDSRFRAFSAFASAAMASRIPSITYEFANAELSIAYDGNLPAFAFASSSPSPQEISFNLTNLVCSIGSTGETCLFADRFASVGFISQSLSTLYGFEIDFSISQSAITTLSTNFINCRVSIGSLTLPTSFADSSFIAAFDQPSYFTSGLHINSSTVSLIQVQFYDTNRADLPAVNALNVYPGATLIVKGSSSATRLGVGHKALIQGTFSVSETISAIALKDSATSLDYDNVFSTDVELYTEAATTTYWVFKAPLVVSRVSFPLLKRIQWHRKSSVDFVTFNMDSASPFGNDLSIGLNWDGTFTPNGTEYMMESNTVLTSSLDPPQVDLELSPKIASAYLGFLWALRTADKRDHLLGKRAITPTNARNGLAFSTDPSMIPAPSTVPRASSPSVPSGCSTPPPTPSTSFICENGRWVSNSSISPSTTNSTTIVISGPTTINGNLSIPTITFEGTGSTIEVVGCADFPSKVILILSLEDYETLRKSRSGYTELIRTHCNGTINGTTPSFEITSRNKKSCERLSGSASSSGETLTATFRLDSSRCNVWWIVLIAIVGGVILIVVVLILIFSLVPSARRCIRPFIKRSEPNSKGNVGS